MKFKTTAFAICYISSMSFAEPNIKEVERIYHINERRWGKHDQAEIGCAIEGSRDFVTFSLSTNAREIEIIYWKETPGMREAGKPANYSAPETNYFSVDDYQKGTLSLKGSSIKINRTLFVNAQQDSSLEVAADLLSDNPKNRLLSKVEEPSKNRPQTLKGRLMCAKPAAQFQLPQPNAPQQEKTVLQESTPSSAPIQVKHLNK
jgi:hypothetical protein